jgi:hypothetical protein
MFDSVSEKQTGTAFTAIASVIAGLLSIFLYPISGLLALVGLTHRLLRSGEIEGKSIGLQRGLREVGRRR